MSRKPDKIYASLLISALLTKAAAYIIPEHIAYAGCDPGSPIMDLLHEGIWIRRILLMLRKMVPSSEASRDANHRTR
jgi:hypothetical protein